MEDAFRSHQLAEKTTDEPLIRVMALHALVYCERLFYLEEVEEIRVADANVYSGRRMHEKLNKGPDIYTLELASEKIGIRGKVDYVRRKQGRLVVYEHKKGRSKGGEEAWPSDRLQALAYSILLAEHSGERIEEARIRYHAENKVIKIPIDMEQGSIEVTAAVNRARELRACIDRPPVTASERLCRTCSLAPVCLPEEERFTSSEKIKIQRLFPVDDDRRVVHLVEQGASLFKDGDQLVVYLPDKTKKVLPGKMISALVLHGNVQISTQCLHFCASNNIGVHWLSYGGHYVGALTAGAGGVQRKNRQFRALQDPMLKSRLSTRLCQAKIENQLRYLLRLTRGKEEKKRDPEVEKGLKSIRSELRQLARIGQRLEQIAEQATDKRDEEEDESVANTIRGHEGRAGREYFGLLPLVLHFKPSDLLYFKDRNRRPPRDPFNALLSFGYALLYRDCVAALLGVGLEPAFGFLHTPRSAAYPLALDLMDLFRVILWDIPLIGSVNRKQWRKEDFQGAGKQVWLNPDGRRKAVALYEARKQEKWKHPVLHYSLSYARTIELEARLLEKEWAGEPGLFAMLRLR